MNLSRRNLLAGAALLAAWPRLAAAAGIDPSEALLALLPDRKAAARLGAARLRLEHRQPDALRQSLSQRLGGGDTAILRDAVAEDFRNGAVVTIGGWQIARTQAELCALAYFAEANRL